MNNNSRTKITEKTKKNGELEDVVAVVVVGVVVVGVGVVQLLLGTRASCEQSFSRDQVPK